MEIDLRVVSRNNSEVPSFPQIMQGFVVGYIGRRVSDKTTLIGSVVIVALSYLVLVSGCGFRERG